MKLLNCRKREGSAESGYTLLEVLIAITLFAIGMLAIAGMQISGLQGNAKAGALTGAGNWAADKVEDLLARAYGHGDLSGGDHGPETDDTGRYTIRWTVTDDVPVNNVKSIAVQVSWSDSGRSRSMVLNYYKADI